NIPLDLIQVGDTNTRTIGNAIASGASVGSDLNGAAIAKACTKLRKRLEDLCTDLRRREGEAYCIAHGLAFWLEEFGWRATVPVAGKPTLMWANILSTAWSNRLDLSADGFYATPKLVEINENGLGHPYFYYIYAAAASEVEVDVLTGEFNVIRS